MKYWIKELYEFHSRDIPVELLSAHVGNGGQSIEYIESNTYPLCPDTYRYHSVQYLINNTHRLKQLKWERDLAKKRQGTSE